MVLLLCELVFRRLFPRARPGEGLPEGGGGGDEDDGLQDAAEEGEGEGLVQQLGGLGGAEGGHGEDDGVRGDAGQEEGRHPNHQQGHAL